ncbi:globoside alpha-1,3-N-acetylgalactosaminyltransferase 1-like isoform X3 [Gouania willdenowi]|uniref:globoside alpha-1,3-N-acetylgalactosaminyltransferase 1-like isoform X3 n=1 Tax=Gouania willdenowi TaxID=441366 RepID=UPI0010559785|nr:globoside alpha-1,3-N-acetylgalactosaminyltransferase 1-like isoform X3 [Gouania willdenowi]
MAFFLFCKSPTGVVRVTRLQMVLSCFLLCLIIYFLHGRKAALSIESAYPVLHALGQVQGSVMTASRQDEIKTPEMTPWGAPLVWGDSPNSAWRRAKFGQQGIQTGLFVLVVGTYTRFIKRFLTSAETHFLPELPGWDRLSYRRMPLLADAIKDPIGSEVDYIFCADVDQEFVAPVEEEILGDLVATLHPELYGMQRSVYPYEDDEGSFAFVEEEEGEYYYTSELYGGLVSEMYKLARACSVLLFQDQANGVTARGLEESYLNRYLIDHRPTCVLSPEYSWWDSALVARVSIQRLVSIGRQCESYDIQQKEQNRC